MNRINFNIKDRKLLYGVLCIVLICVFTLSIAYAALNAVLTISGNAEVTSSNWNIHLENPVVKNGSVTTNVPVIKSNSVVEFSTTLNMPGDFYEFTVDVVNSGSIDAMIDSVSKTPELSTEQAKYLKYEVSYANNESINSKQTIASGVTMPIKVRIEYRKDLSSGDLPTGQVVLDLSLTLNYIQSDGTGSSVTNNGASYVKVISGDGFTFGDEVCISSECFHVISSTDETVKMIANMNIILDEVSSFSEQSINAGTTIFSNDKVEYNDSNVDLYCRGYGDMLNTNYGVQVIESRAISYEELTDPNTFNCDFGGICDTYSWVSDSVYWTSSVYGDSNVWVVNDRLFDYANYRTLNTYGVRPVIVISKDYF